MKSRLPSIEEELKRLNEATISREKAFDRAKVNYDLLFAQLANRANREGSSQESSLNARIESLQMEKFALLKNVMELQQQAQLLSTNISACNDKKRRLEQLVETLRSEKLDLENRIQGMQSENERLSRELEGIRELRLKRKRLNGDHNALKIPKIEMSVEENGCQESVSVSAEQIGQTAMDQVSDKLDVGARQVAEGEMTHRNHLLDDDAHEDGNGNQDSALFNNEYVDVKKEEEESLIGDDMGSDPEDSEYDANDASDSEEPLEGARQTSDGEMAQHDEEGNGNQDTALFNNEFFNVKEEEGSLFEDDMESDPEDSDYDMDDTSDFEEPLKGARHKIDGEMAQGDEERNANKSNALFDYENVVVKEEEEEESLFGVVMGRKPEGTESNDASHEKEHDIEGTVKRCYNCRSRDIGRYVNGKHACKACQDYYKKYGENRPEYLCQRPIRRRVKNRDPGVFCYNCFDTRRDQKRWRRVKGMDACYSCGTYYHRTKADRPMALVHYSRSDQRKRWLGRRPQEEKRCYNCGVTNNAGEGWKRVDGKTSCSTCKHYRRKHPNEDRPEYLWRKAPRKEKTCYNCSFIIPKRGSYRVQGEVACSACKRYYVGTGRHRPEHLCRRPKKTQLRLLGTEGKCYNCPFILLKGIPRRQVEGKMSCCTCGHYYERTGQHRPEHLWRETLKKQERKATGNELRSDAVANVDDMKASGSSNSAPPCPRVDGDVDSGEIQSQRLTLWRLLGSLVEPHAAPLHRPHVNDDIDLKMMGSPIAQPVVDNDVKVNLGVHADTVMEGETFTPHCHQDEAAAWCAPLNPFQEIKIEELSNDDCN